MRVRIWVANITLVHGKKYFNLVAIETWVEEKSLDYWKDGIGRRKTTKTMNLAP